MQKSVTQSPNEGDEWFVDFAFCFTVIGGGRRWGGIHEKSELDSLSFESDRQETEP